MIAELLKSKKNRTPKIRKKRSLVRLGANVADHRRTLGIEQMDFAKRIAISGETYRNFEDGCVELDSEKIREIAEKLGCTTLELFGMARPS